MLRPSTKKIVLENRNVRISLNEHNLYDLEVKTYYQDLCQELIYLHHIERKYKKLKAQLRRPRRNSKIRAV
jgi:hypothetical protein